MKLSVIIPAHNEAATIGELLALVLAEGKRQYRAGIVFEVIVVDDASTDATARIVEGLNSPAIRLIRHPANRGKGAAIRSALAAAAGDAVIIQDADLEYAPSDYASIIGLMIRTGAPVVYGSRILGKNPKSYARFYWGGRFLTVLFNLLYGTRLTDLTTCYKAFRGDTIRSLPLTCEGFEFCPEVTARLARRGIPIEEVPISYRPRTIAAGKKIRWHDGVLAVVTMIGLRWRRSV